MIYIMCIYIYIYTHAIYKYYIYIHIYTLLYCVVSAIYCYIYLWDSPVLLHDVYCCICNPLNSPAVDLGCCIPGESKAHQDRMPLPLQEPASKASHSPHIMFISTSTLEGLLCTGQRAGATGNVAHRKHGPRRPPEAHITVFSLVTAARTSWGTMSLLLTNKNDLKRLVWPHPQGCAHREPFE